MDRIEKLETLIKIEEGIKYFDTKIEELQWTNLFGIGLEIISIRLKNTNDIDTCERAIDRLNERFSKLVTTLK